MTDVHALLPELQRELRLQDWRVELKVCRYYELPDGLSGHCSLVLSRKMATIQVMVPHDLPPQPDVFKDGADPEETLIHELIHLHFEPFWDNNKKIVMEQAIDALTQAIFGLRKRNRQLEARIRGMEGGKQPE